MQDETDALLAAELAQAVERVREHGIGEVSVRGQRILIIAGDHSAAMTAAAMARLAMVDGVMLRPHEILVGLDIGSDRGRDIGIDDPMLHLRALEPQIVADFKAIEERPSKGKGDRRKPWESPYGNPGGKRHKGGHHQNLRKMLPRRGGR